MLVVIHSVFIIKDGLPLVVQSCSPQAQTFGMDETRLTGLLTAMSTFCAELGGAGEMQALQTTNNLQFSFIKRVEGDEPVLFVACHDTALPAGTAQRALRRVAAKFMDRYQNLGTFAGETGVFADFGEEIPQLVAPVGDAPEVGVQKGSFSSSPITPAGLPGLPPLPDIPDPRLAIEQLENACSAHAAESIAPITPSEINVDPSALNYGGIVPVLRAPSVAVAHAVCGGASAAQILGQIDGLASIGAIAQNTGIAPDIVFRFCRHFIKYGLVGLTSAN